MTNNKLLEKHPDLAELLRKSKISIYKILEQNGTIQEFWECDKDGNWTDQTGREKLCEQIEAAQEELERLRRAEAYKLANANKETDDDRIE